MKNGQSKNKLSFLNGLKWNLLLIILHSARKPYCTDAKMTEEIYKVASDQRESILLTLLEEDCNQSEEISKETLGEKKFK